MYFLKQAQLGYDCDMPARFYFHLASIYFIGAITGYFSQSLSFVLAVGVIIFPTLILFLIGVEKFKEETQRKKSTT